MATYTCKGCKPIDASIIDAYVALIGATENANNSAANAEEATTAANNAATSANNAALQATNAANSATAAATAANAAGITQAEASVDSNTGTPSVDVSLVNKKLSLSFHNIKGEKGEKGDRGDGAVPVINDLVTGGTDAALSAEMGKTLNNTKQATLVSGTNIKTVNGESLLGEGNIIAGDPNAVKYVEQTLTDAQKTQARTNIGAYQKPDTGIPATDLASAAQTSLGKADTAYQKPSAGIPKLDLESGVQASLDLADSAIQARPMGEVDPTITPADYATKEELDELEAEVNEKADQAELSQLQQEVDELPEELKSEFPYASENIGDLSFSDEQGNVIAEFYDGHIRTKEFDSKLAQEEIEATKEGVQVLEERTPFAKDNDDADSLLFTDEDGNVIGGWKDGHEVAKYPSSYTKDNEFTALDIEDENGNRVASLFDGHIKTKNFWSKDLNDKVNELYQNGAKHKINILFVGNSMTQDAISYLPYVLKQIAPDIIFNFYIYYTGGFTLADQYENFINEYIPGTFSICENVVRWTNNNSWDLEGIHKPMKDWLSEIQFDILCLQDYFSTQPTTDNAVTDFNNCVNYIRDHYDGRFKVVNLFHRPRTNVFDEHGPQSTLECFNMIETAAEQCMKNTACQSVLVPGVAAYFATLDPILQPLGDIGNLTADGSHAQDTMACLMQAYTAALWVFDELGLPYGIYNKGIRATQEVYAAVNPPGPNVGSGIIVGTDEQNNEAQLIAVKAFKYGKNLVNNSLV